MLKLTFSQASPYVRKVLISAYRAGIQNEIELVDAGTEYDKFLRSKNPLGKIPVLQKDDGDFLFDSRVIKVTGKRNKQRMIPMLPNLSSNITDYINNSDPKI